VSVFLLLASLCISTLSVDSLSHSYHQQLCQSLSSAAYTRRIPLPPRSIASSFGQAPSKLCCSSRRVCEMRLGGWEM
jgi:hypothetical protein